MSPDAQPEPAEAVEPVEAEDGQGTDESSGLYDDYLSDIPDEFHEKVIDGFKAKDADFTRRFTAVSDKWKPYDELGVGDTDPEQLGGWLNLDKALEAAQGGDEQANENVYSWWEQLGEQLGYYNGEEGKEESSEDEEDFDPFDPSNIEKMISEQVEKAVNPLQEAQTQQEQAQKEAEADQAVSEVTDKLKSDNPGLTDSDIDDILELSIPHMEGAESPEAAVAAGFEKFKS